MFDTPQDIEERIAKMMAQRTPVDRLKMVSSMFDSGKALMVAGLLKQNSSLNEGQLRAQIFLRLYGECYTRDETERIMKRIPNMQPVIEPAGQTRPAEGPNPLANPVSASPAP